MQAVILVGGEGTRLRPLTSTVPKPVVQLVDRPFIAFMLEWLQRARDRRRDHVLRFPGRRACATCSATARSSGSRLRFVEEPDPRGTAGALKFAERLLDERFLMLNGDVLTDIDLTGQIAQHERTGARATLALAPVARPERLRAGAPERGPLGASDFIEKPSADSDRHEPDQRRRLRARARDPPARPARSQRLDRARGLAALIGDGLYGFPAGRLLARHRHARALPAGHLRHHRGQRRDGRARAPGRELAGGRGGRRDPRPGDPAGGDRARRARRRRARTSAAWSCSARTCASAPARRSSVR